MRIVLLGAPGSGKGTQSQLLQRRAGIPQISTGDLLRAAVAGGTELGRQAKDAMDSGRLVDDSLVLGMIRERLAEPDTARGFILDGFPRNLAQAHALDRLLDGLEQPLDAVVQLEVDYRELVRRISGRRTCADCGRVFNLLTSPPAGADQVCPQTGAAHRLVQRPDDNEATVTERLRVYEEKTRPLIDFYRTRGLLRVINAEGSVDEVAGRLGEALDLSEPAATRAPSAAKSARRKTTGRKASRATATRTKAARGKLTRTKGATSARRRGSSSRAKSTTSAQRRGALRTAKAKAAAAKRPNSRRGKRR
ncbi:MAG TPA: adenylate kinase [Steroidobacteraceae bacterium]|nr:adenylate kinase [Steroidobacteraceae bacterium]